MMNEQASYIKALSKWNGNIQTDIMIEEMAELTKALLKYRRNRTLKTNLTNILEELVDVEIMLGQMKIFYEPREDQFKKIKQYKLKRLEKLLETESDEK